MKKKRKYFAIKKKKKVFCHWKKKRKHFVIKKNLQFLLDWMKERERISLTTKALITGLLFNLYYFISTDIFGCNHYHYHLMRVRECNSKNNEYRNNSKIKKKISSQLQVNIFDTRNNLYKWAFEMLILISTIDFSFFFYFCQFKYFSVPDQIRTRMNEKN